MGADRRTAVTARLIQWAALWLALFGCADALAHVTTTGLLRIEVAEGRVLYALSVALPELPAASAAMLSAAANGNRTAAEGVAETARNSIKIDLGNIGCRTGRVRVGGGRGNGARATRRHDLHRQRLHGPP